ncbi:hypothetical protein QYF36_005259 [Acer negundo]|nr:hypothetical protein QYF36_005259 [Acer negundo]
MAPLLFFFPILLFNFHFQIAHGTELSYVPESSSLQTYIVHVKHPQGRVLTESEDLESWHKSFLLSSVANSNLQQERMVYSYKNVINGFAAKLTEEEVQTMKTMDGFISARPERRLRKQTTRTPHFLGLHAELGFWKQSNFGKGVIIGVLDGGILPSHPSFSDEGMPPPPAKWKGRCEFNISACNNKLIGARTFNIAGKGKGVEPPNDVDGHGTHVASTAAGGFVQYADALGNAPGTAVGMAPYAHLAIYKAKDFPSTLMPLVYAGMNGKPESALCGNGSLNGTDVKGKIVLCERGGGIGRIDKGVEVKNAGGAAMILMNDEPNAFSTLTDLHVLPATHISFADGLKIKSYINSTATPMATILFKGTVIGIPQTPMVTSFSSRGQLNYPSFSVTLGPSQTFTRTVTNVGWGNTSYYAMVVAPQGVEVCVKPSRLYFSNVNQKATYSVTFSRTGSGYKMGEFAQGYIKWVSTKYTVRSPISVRFE